MTTSKEHPEPLIKLCQSDNWSQVLDDPAPRAVRWATRSLERLCSPDWSKWHYTEGNGSFTACGRPVIPFEVDNSPQEREIARITCRVCRVKMAPFVTLLSKMEAGTATLADLAPQWQQDYCIEYARTTGQIARFSPVQRGGWTTLTSEHEGALEVSTRMRKKDVLAATERLKARPSRPTEDEEDKCLE